MRRTNGPLLLITGEPYAPVQARVTASPRRQPPRGQLPPHTPRGRRASEPGHLRTPREDRQASGENDEAVDGHGPAWAEPGGEPRRDHERTGSENLVLKLVLVSAHLLASGGTEAGPKPR